jgi:hypothetical protein
MPRSRERAVVLILRLSKSTLVILARDANRNRILIINHFAGENAGPWSDLSSFWRYTRRKAGLSIGSQGKSRAKVLRRLFHSFSKKVKPKKCEDNFIPISITDERIFLRHGKFGGMKLSNTWRGSDQAPISQGS